MSSEDIKLNKFIASIKKVSQSRNYKVTNSIGVYSAYKWLRKNKWLNIGRPLTEHEFYSIIRKVNNYLADSFLEGNDIKLPCRMGRIELRKEDARFILKNGKIKTNLAIDWDKTLRLWYEDEEAYKNKTLVRVDKKELFKVYYNKNKADYANKSFYEFKVNRDLRNRLNQRAKEGLLDAFKSKRYGLE